MGVDDGKTVGVALVGVGVAVLKMDEAVEEVVGGPTVGRVVGEGNTVVDWEVVEDAGDGDADGDEPVVPRTKDKMIQKDTKRER